MEQLPINLLVEILSLFHEEEIVRLRLVCKIFKKMVDSDNIWEGLFFKSFGRTLAKPISWKNWYIDYFVRDLDLHFVTKDSSTEIQILNSGKSVISDDGNTNLLFTDCKPLTKGKYFWEIQLDSYSKDSCFCVGVSKYNQPTEDSPDCLGMDSLTWCFFGGSLFGRSHGRFHTNDSNNGNYWILLQEEFFEYGEDVTMGDRIGTLLNLDRGEISFFKNGMPMGVAFDGMEGPLYPAFTVQVMIKFSLTDGKFNQTTKHI